MQRVADWLNALGLGQYAQRFADNEIDASVLRDLTDQDLEKIGVSLGHRKKILHAIAEFDDAGSPPEPARPNVAERRQITVMFCDLVGSTELSTRLDPEDLREIIGAYHRCCAAQIAKTGGFVAKYMGDGVLAYFGYPQAHEDDGERAVRAGLALVEAVPKLDAHEGTALQVRIGIATGLVVVGDLLGEGAAQEQAVVGETPNLAARLQALAEPGAVVISGSTRGLTARLFEYHDLGTVALKGLTENVPAWQVLRASATESRFEALRTATTPLVGRDEETELLLRRWEQAKRGDGQVVLIAGEPGIGKSRLAQTVLERLSGEPHTALRLFCSPHHQDTTLHPTITQLKRAAGFRRDETDRQRLSKLEAVLAEATNDLNEVACLIAELLGVPTLDRYPRLNLTPQKRKEKTLRALLAQVEGLAAHQPAVMLFEDVHWIDPTSLELLDLVINRLPTLAVLLIITFRPEFTPPWVGRPQVTVLSLSRLPPRQRGKMIMGVTGGKQLPEEIAEQIIDRTDGVPLFIEELTKSVIESGLVTEAGGHYAVTGPAAPLAIPTTLHASLLARLDRLATTREVAQIGAAIGRSFSHQLISAVTSMLPSQLDDAMAQLVRAELIFRRGTPPDAEYTFKHALVQDAAYSTLLRGRRKQIHARIATILEGNFPEIVDAQPELVGQHCSEGGFGEKAISYWTLAGERAAKRGANTEAIRHFRRALRALEKLPETAERSKAELRVLDKLGPALATVEGWAAPQAEAAYQRARQLARNLGSPADAVPALIGLWLYHFQRAEPNATHQATQELFEIGHSTGDHDLLLQAHHSAWPTSAYDGDFTTAIHHIERGLALYDERARSHHAIVYLGHDPAVCAHTVGAVVTCILGYPEQAESRARAGIGLARRLGHAPTLAHALWFTAKLHIVQNKIDEVHAVTTELLALCEEQHLVPPAMAGTIFQGWSKVRAGQIDDGLRQLRKGLEAMKRGGNRVYLAHRISLLAEACALAGNWDEASASCEEAIKTVHETGDEWFLAKILSQRSELLLNGPRMSEEQAEVCLKDALDVARRQRARWYELRASCDLARLWRDQGKPTRGRNLLAPIYGWFTEGFDTPVLKEAKALLDQLA
jgi:class 3 adenylate cyclase/predicted ATPase